jgi:hypothetical protein
MTKAPRPRPALGQLAQGKDRAGSRRRSVAGLAIDKLAVYEVPYNMAEDWPLRWRDYVEQLGNVLAEGRRSDAIALFMRLTGFSDEDVAALRSSSYWPDMEASPTRSATTQPAWETANHLPLAWQRSRSRLWWPPVTIARLGRRAGSWRSMRPRTPSPRASPERNDKRYRGRDT